MKPTLLLLTVITCAAFTTPTFANDPAEPAKCEMMKKPAAAQDTTDAARAEASARVAELDRLVTEMNSNTGPKKLEAMTAIITRLVDQARTEATAAPAAGKGEGAPKAEAHHH